MMSLLETLRESWEKLSDRERRLLSMMGGVGALIVTFALVWTASTALSEVEDERDQLRGVLTDIDRAGDSLSIRRAERLALTARYETKSPALAAYVESKAKEHGLEVRQVLEEPEKVVNGYRKQSVRVSFSNVSLRPIMHLLTSIESEQAAIAVDRIVIEHYASGDSYKLDLSLASYEAPKKTPKPAAGESATGKP